MNLLCQGALPSSINTRRMDTCSQKRLQVLRELLQCKGQELQTNSTAIVHTIQVPGYLVSFLEMVLQAFQIKTSLQLSCLPDSRTREQPGI